MRRRLLAGFLAFAVILIAVLEVPLAISEANDTRAAALSEVENDGASLALLVGASLERGDTVGARSLIERYSHAEHALVAVVASRRIVVSSGAGVGEELDDPSTVAILRAAETGRVVGEEGSRDPDDDLLYVAIPLALGASATTPDPGADAARAGEPAVLLVAVPAAALHATTNADRRNLVLLGLAVLAVAAGLGTWLAVSLTRPLARIESTVAGIGAGTLATRVPDSRAPPELRALGATVNAMADRIEELLVAQRAFVADASHQLRAPMTALRLRLENLEGALAPGHDADLVPLLGEVDRLSRVVDGLLELARTDGTRPHREAVDVASVLADRLEAWGALAAERSITLEGDVPAAPEARASLGAMSCPGFLEQVLDNLLANALDATPPRGTVSLSAVRTGGHVEVHVADSGPGMDEQDRARAFDRFWRTEGSRREGTGLGLAIVAQLVRLSGGSTWLGATASGGVDATVRLEAAAPDRAPPRPRPGG